MKKLIWITIAMAAIAIALASCGNEIKPKRPIVDQPGVVFIENGRYDTVNTSITTEQLKQALVEKNWEFSYSFFYDDYKIGPRGEDVWYSRVRYHFDADGTAVSTNLADGKQITYRYSVNARMVSLQGKDASFKFGVIAMDSRHMICDESLVGQVARDYDPASLTRRMVFLSRK